MNIKFVLTPLIVLFSLSLMGQDPFSMSQKEIELNRKKHCLTSEIMYVQKVKNNGELEEKQLRAKSKYNKNGLTIDGESNFNGTKLRNTYEYDEFMNTVKSEIYYKDKLKEQNVVEYDEDGTAYRISSYYQNGRLFNTDKKKVKLRKTEAKEIKSKLNYDSLAYTYYKKSGINLSKDEYKLDNEGRIIKWVDIDNSTYEKSFKEYEYMENHYVETEIFYNYDDTIDRKYIRTFNYKNLLIESKWFNGKGNLKQISTYEYGYCTEKK